MKYGFSLALALTMTLMGCAVPTKPHALVAPAHPRTLVLSADLAYPSAGPGNPSFGPADYNAAIAGEYVAELENDLGTFYRGKGACIVWWTDDSANLRALQEGGIWVAKGNETPRFRLYRFENPQAERVEHIRPVAGADDAIDPETRAKTLLRARGQKYDDVSGSKMPSTVPATVPRGTSPLQAGLAGGIAYGLIALMSTHSSTTIESIILMSDPPSDVPVDGRYSLR